MTGLALSASPPPVGERPNPSLLSVTRCGTVARGPPSHLGHGVTLPGVQDLGGASFTGRGAEDSSLIVSEDYLIFLKENYAV